MNENIMQKTGYDKYLKTIKEGKCPFCKKQIDIESFKDELSLKEFAISGLCQKCQDEVFG